MTRASGRSRPWRPGPVSAGRLLRVSIVSPLAAPPYRDRRAGAATTRRGRRSFARSRRRTCPCGRSPGIPASSPPTISSSPIGVYADCGRVGDERVEGEALVAFTVFVQPNGDADRGPGQCEDADPGIRRGLDRQAQVRPGLSVRVDGPLRGEPVRHGARAGEGVAMPPRLPDLIGSAPGGSPLERDRLIQELAREWTPRSSGQGFSPTGPRRALGRADRGRGAAARQGATQRRRRRGDPARGARGHRPRQGAGGGRACRGVERAPAAAPRRSARCPRSIALLRALEDRGGAARHPAAAPDRGSSARCSTPERASGARGRRPRRPRPRPWPARVVELLARGGRLLAAPGHQRARASCCTPISGRALLSPAGARAAR